jgi:(Z)-2-((N-methylformamido)methylene)-5-hydroxybutyrolactone dehydrogenase
MLQARFRLFINGSYRDAKSTFASIDPATGEPWAVMPAADEDEVDAAVQAAHRALRTGPWTKLNATQRGKLIVRLGDLVASSAELLADLETRDTGKIIRETRAQVAYAGEYYRYFGGLADKVQGAWLPIDKPDMEVSTRNEPIGVVAAVVPWNSQLFLSAVKTGPALAAGCTVVLKASEDGPAPLLEFARLVSEAGFPDGVVNVITGYGDTCGRALTSHPLVSRIAFTGGPETARRVLSNSANNLAYTTLELGGKSPVVVFADANQESAANAIVAGIFAAAGQSCVAGSRLLVEKSIEPQLLERLAVKARAIRIGPPQEMATEMGPLATERQRENIERHIKSTVDAGGTLVCGGKRPPGFQRGFFFEPTIIRCSSGEQSCLRHELFGPVLTVQTFRSEEEALALANDTEFGLASGVFTSNLSRAHRMSAGIRAGIVWVNTYRAISPMAPFGGFGLSGSGREGGLNSIADYTRSKAVWIRTSDEPIPDPFIMR